MGRDDISTMIHLEEGYSHETETEYGILFKISNQLRDLGKMAFFMVQRLKNIFYQQTMLSFTYSLKFKHTVFKTKFKCNFAQVCLLH